MKKITLLILTFFHVLIMHGQVDSFKVEGRTFQFETPKDWILESKDDGVQYGPSSNLSLHYVIDTKDLFAGISVRIDNRNVIDTTHYKKDRSKLRYESELVDECGFRIAKTTSKKQQDDDAYDCKTCAVLKREFWIYPLNENLSLILSFYSKASPKLLDSLHSVFTDFSKIFFKQNEFAIRSYIPFSNLTTNTSTETVEMKSRYLKFHYYTGWRKPQYESQLSEHEVLRQHYIGISHIDSVSLLATITSASTLINDPAQDLEKYQIKVGYIHRDTVNGIPCYFYSYKLDESPRLRRNGFNTYGLTYYFKTKGEDETLLTYRFYCEISIKNSIDFIYYQEFLKSYMTDFVKTNALNPI